MMRPRPERLPAALVALALVLVLGSAEGNNGPATPPAGHELDGFWQLEGKDRFGPYRGTLRVRFLNGSLYRLDGAPEYADGVSRAWSGEALLLRGKLSLTHPVPAGGMLEALAGEGPPTDAPPRISRTYDLDDKGLTLRGIVRYVRGPVKVVLGNEVARRRVPPAAGFETVPATESTLTLHVWRSAPKRLKYESPRALFAAYFLNHAARSKHSIGHVAVEVKTIPGAFPRGNDIYAGHTGDPEPFMIRLARRSAPLKEVFGTFPCGYLHGRVAGDAPHVTVEFTITREQAVAAMDFITRYRGDLYGLFPAGSTASDDIVKAGIESGGGCISFGVGVLTSAGIDLSGLAAQRMTVSRRWMEEGGYTWWLLPFHASWQPHDEPGEEVTFYTPDLLADWCVALPPAVQEKYRARVVKGGK